MTSFNRCFDKWLDILLLLIKFSIFVNQCNFMNVKAIVGENIRQAQELEFPYVVAIMKIVQNGPQLPRHQVCTGSLVSLQDVLTAEHCLLTHHPLGIEIKVNSTDLLLGEKYYPLWWMTYNQWTTHNCKQLEFQSNDIAMIKLTGNVPFQTKFATIATTPDKYKIGSNVQIMGWGKTNDGKIPRMLQTATVKLISNMQCTNMLFELTNATHPLHKRRLCTAKRPYILINDGDSGGPLVYRNIIIGVNKGVAPKLNVTIHPKQVNFHFSTFYYKDFILNIIEKFEINF